MKLKRTPCCAMLFMIAKDWDSLKGMYQILLKKQKQIDSTIAVYETKVSEIDFQIDNIKEKTTIVREYYHEVGQQVGKYTPTQIDSFFKARYNY